MNVTSIVPCIKVTKENNMAGMDMYLEYGTKIRLTSENGEIVDGTILFLELSQYEEQDDILYLRLDNGKQFNIGISYIIDIEEV